MLVEQRQTGGEWQRARRARLLRLNPKRPLALAAAARYAADHVLAPAGGDQRGELPARPLGLLEVARGHQAIGDAGRRSEEHTSELQSHSDLVCRLLLEKKNPDRPPRLPEWPHHTVSGPACRRPPRRAEPSPAL